MRSTSAIRLVLAATLSSNYGIYGPTFELCENIPREPGSEEYLHSEKDQIRPRDWDAPGNIKARIARVNEIRHDSPALSLFTNLRFLPTDNDRIIFYVKATPELDDVLLVAVNLDPHAPHHATAWVPPDAVGVAPGQPYEVRDLLEGGRWTWGERNYVRLVPAVCPAHILRVERRL